MGVLDKYRVRGNRGQLPVKGLFNPGRNQQWDWNELLQTIENNFSTDDSDLAALTARVTTNEAEIANNSTDIGGNETAIGTNETAIETNATAIAGNTEAYGSLEALVETNGINIATNTTAITKMCACLNAAFETIGGDAQAVWEECEGNPCIG